MTCGPLPTCIMSGKKKWWIDPGLFLPSYRGEKNTLHNQAREGRDSSVRVAHALNEPGPKPSEDRSSLSITVFFYLYFLQFWLFFLCLGGREAKDNRPRRGPAVSGLRSRGNRTAGV